MSRTEEQVSVRGDRVVRVPPTPLDTHESYMLAAEAAERLRERLNADRFYRVTRVVLRPVAEEYLVMAWSRDHAARRVDEGRDAPIRQVDGDVETRDLAIVELPDAEVCHGCLKIVVEPVRLRVADLIGLQALCGDCAAVAAELVEEASSG